MKTLQPKKKKLIWQTVKKSLNIALCLLLVFSAFLVLVPLANAQSEWSFYPTNYSLVSSTAYVSGVIGDLQADDGVNMQFRSYVSAIGSSKTDAFIGYRSNTGTSTLSSPKSKTWDGDTATWSGESELTTAGSPVRFVRVETCPVSARTLEKVEVSLSDNGYLDAYVYDGTSWTVTNDIGFVGVTANAYKPYDIAYETTTGRILLAYGIASTNTAQDLAYKIWTFGSGWSAESYIDDTGHATDIQYYWVQLAANPTVGSNEVTLVGIDATDSDGNGWVWNSAAKSLSWGSIQELDATVSITTKECIAVAYESSGRAWTAVGSGSTASTISMRSQIGGTWDVAKTNPNVGAVPNWVSLKGDPSSNKMMLTSNDASLDLNIVYYSGSGSWTVNGGSPAFTEDAAVDSIAARCVDFAWEPTGSKGLIVWGTLAGSISRQPWTGTGWGTTVATAMGANIHPWVQLRGNTQNVANDIKILGAIMEAVLFDVGIVSWDGTTFTIIGTNTITADTVAITYECYELEFMCFSKPTAFTSAVEFGGTSNANGWTQIKWTVDLSFTAESVTATLQLWNYTLGGYSPANNGYIQASIGTANATQTQTITVNPTQFRDGSGNWQLKITGAKTVATQFDLKVDFVLYNPSIRHTVTFYFNEANGNSFLVNNAVVSNGTSTVYLNATVLNLKALAAANDSYTFSYFLIGAVKVYQNNYDYTVTVDITIWCYFASTSSLYSAGYNAGYTAGNSSGYSQGWTAGNATGYASGWIDGNSTGYATGYNAGFIVGNSTGWTQGNATGYSTGYANGYAGGWADGNSTGYASGWIDGNATGYVNGWNAGNATGYNDGWSAGNSTGYTSGWNAGYSSGYDDGWSAGNAIGYSNGWVAGNSTGYSQGWLEGNATGYATGYNIGWNDGNATGWIQGNSTGYADGWNAGNVTGYSQGWNEGNSTGYASGYSIGYDEGYGEGSEAGYTLGYDDGFINGNYTGWVQGNATGYLNGWADGNQTGYTNGYSVGYGDGLLIGNYTGYTQGWEIGNSTGYSVGYANGVVVGNATGYAEGWNVGNSTGFFNGWTQGNQTGYSVGWVNGNQTGYALGYAEGFKDGQSGSGWQSSSHSGQLSPPFNTLTIKVFNWLNAPIQNASIRITNYYTNATINMTRTDKNGTSLLLVPYATLGIYVDTGLLKLFRIYPYKLENANQPLIMQADFLLLTAFVLTFSILSVPIYLWIIIVTSILTFTYLMFIQKPKPKKEGKKEGIKIG